MEANEYGVIICPKCKTARGIHLRQKTARCPKCGKIWVVRNLKIICTVKDARKLQKVVATVNMNLGKNPKSYL